MSAMEPGHPMRARAERRARRSAAAFLRDRSGVTGVDWVVLTAMVAVAGLAAVYFVLGDEGGASGLIDVFTDEVNQSSSNLSGVREGGVGVATGGSGGGGGGSGGGGSGGGITVPDSPGG